MVQYAAIMALVQHLAPTWRKTQDVNFAQLVAAILERENLALSDLVRAVPEPTQPLHGRLKRGGRFLDNPRLDETALFVRWLKLTSRFGADLPQAPDARPLVPLLLDTVDFPPFALLVCTVPCGSRGLPVALPPPGSGRVLSSPPDVALSRRGPNPPRPRRPRSASPAGRRPSRRAKGAPAATPTPFLSQNHLEEERVDDLFALLSPALPGVIVADRGFARASFFPFPTTRQHSFVIRVDAPTAGSGRSRRRDSSALSPGALSAGYPLGPASGGKSYARGTSFPSLTASPAGSPPISGPGFPAGVPPNSATASAPGGPPPRDQKAGTASRGI